MLRSVKKHLMNLSREDEKINMNNSMFKSAICAQLNANKSYHDHNWDEGKNDEWNNPTKGEQQKILNASDCFGLFNILLAVRMIFLLQHSQKCFWFNLVVDIAKSSSNESRKKMCQPLL